MITTACRHFLFFALGLLASATGSVAQSSPFNGRQIPLPDSTGHYRFIVSGHFYGDGRSSVGFPVATLLGNLDTINALGASFMLSTGDLFQDAKGDRSRYQRSLFEKLELPLFNAVGNHDLDGGRYQDLFGATSFTFDVGTDRFVVLDTERDDSSLDDEQLNMLAHAANDAQLRKVFIISHRPVWAEAEEDYGRLFPNNTRALAGNNFRSAVYPILDRMAAHADIYWMAGSMGGNSPASIFFQPHARNITYLQSAIRGTRHDALLIADVGPDSVRWSALSLTGQKLQPVAEYSADWWRTHLGRQESFNWRLFPYYLKITTTHRAFWIGVGSSLVLLIGIRWIRRKRAGSRD